jgi:hypothetical protein
VAAKRKNTIDDTKSIYNGNFRLLTSKIIISGLVNTAKKDVKNSAVFKDVQEKLFIIVEFI